MYLTPYLSWISRSLRCASATLSAVAPRMSWRSMKIGMAPIPSFPALRRWSDVLVDAEQVLRVIFRLDGGEPSGIAEIGPPDAILVILRYEVHVGAAGRERCTGVEQRPRPGDASCVFGRIAPPCVKINQEGNIPVRIGRRFRRHAIDRTAELHKGQLGFRRRQLAGVLDKNVDEAVLDGGERV